MAFHLGALPETKKNLRSSAFGAWSVPESFGFIEKTVAERRSLQHLSRKLGGAQSA
jgi:hypothetical protein